MKKFLIVVVALLCSVLVLAAPKNIIVIMGDGMGMNHLFFSELLSQGKSLPVYTEQFEVRAVGTNTPMDTLITDSAAAATAFFCGVRTNTSFLGLDPQEKEYDSLMKIFKTKGYTTGLITNTRYNDATPAGAYAHTYSRHDTSKITQDLVDNDYIDFIVAGGLDKLGVNIFTAKPNPTSKLKDMADKGYDIYGLNYKKLFDHQKDYKGFRAFVAMGDKNFENELFDNEMSFSRVVENTLTIADVKDPLFLFIECGRIDDACHANKTESVAADLLEFQKVVGLVLSKFDPAETLFVIFADHETGGLSMLAGANDGTNIKIGWTIGDHTAAYIPILAKGPNSQLFNGKYHLSELHNRILQAMAE